jgi:GAF domain-containing protein
MAKNSIGLIERQVILEEGLRITGSVAGHIRLLDKQDRNLKLVVATGFERHELQVTQGIGEGICGQVATTGQPSIMADIREADAVVHSVDLGSTPDKVASKGIQSLACLPMIARDRLIGVLFIASSRVNAFGPEEVRLLKDVANRGAVAIQAAAMFEEIEGDLRMGPAFPSSLMVPPPATLAESVNGNAVAAD